MALHHFFVKHAGDDSKIKWPNDLYWQDRKAGGILIESIVGSGGNWDWAICGIGININQTSFSTDLPNPVSLKQITGKDFKVVSLAKELCSCLDEKFQELINSGFEPIYNQYLNQLYKLNDKVRLKKDSRVFEAIIKSVSPVGKLVVQHAIEEEFNFGEVELVVYPYIINELNAFLKASLNCIERTFKRQTEVQPVKILVALASQFAC